jgi:hypothetical protein
MRLFIFLTVLMVSGCVGISPIQNCKLDSGRYILECKWGDDSAYKVDVLLENDDGVLEIISPLSGKMVCGGVLDGNHFLMSYSEGNLYMTYRGNLIAENKVNGDMRGRVQADMHRAYPVDIKKKNTVLRKGSFALYPYQFKRSKSVTDFLATVNVSSCFLSTFYDPRAFSFLVNSKGELFKFRNVKYNVSGNIISSFEKEAISQKQFKDSLEKAIEEYGTDIPFEIFVEKRSTFSAISKIFTICRKMNIYNIYLVALHPKWGGLLKFPFGVNGNFETPKSKRTSLKIKITSEGYFCDNKKISDLSLFLKNVRDKYKTSDLIVSYLENTPIQKFISFINLSYPNRLNTIIQEEK